MVWVWIPKQTIQLDRGFKKIAVDEGWRDVEMAVDERWREVEMAVDER